MGLFAQVDDVSLEGVKSRLFRTGLDEERHRRVGIRASIPAGEKDIADRYAVLGASDRNHSEYRKVNG